MIIEFEIIDRPYSGEFEEIIYDHPSPWNSQMWTYVKFTNDDYTDWCGVFRGFNKNIAISNLKNEILILTSDYLWRLSADDGEMIDRFDQPSFRLIEVTPNGEFILADYYEICRLGDSKQELIFIKPPKKLDMIEFKGWHYQKLQILADEFLNWNKKIELELNCENWNLEIKTPHNKS